MLLAAPRQPLGELCSRIKQVIGSSFRTPSPAKTVPHGSLAGLFVPLLHLPRLAHRSTFRTDHLIEVRGDASALSLRAIAEHVGIATTSIYLHFADLTELKLAVAQRGFIEFAAARDQAAAGIADPMDALTARCLAYIDHAAAHPGRYRLMFGRQLANLAPNTSTGVPSNAALHALEDSIRQCTKAGAIAANIDPVRSAVLIWTALHGQASLQIDRPNFPWPPRRELVTDLVRRLLGVPAGDAQS